MAFREGKGKGISARCGKEPTAEVKTGRIGLSATSRLRLEQPQNESETNRCIGRFTFCSLLYLVTMASATAMGRNPDFSMNRISDMAVNH